MAALQHNVQVCTLIDLISWFCMAEQEVQVNTNLLPIAIGIYHIIMDIQSLSTL